MPSLARRADTQSATHRSPNRRPNKSVALGDLSFDGQDQRQRDIGRAVGHNIGRIGDPNTAGLSGSEIDRIDPDAEASDDLKSRQRLDRHDRKVVQRVDSNGAYAIASVRRKAPLSAASTADVR
jgi:hypothetical protein